MASNGGVAATFREKFLRKISAVVPSSSARRRAAQDAPLYGIVVRVDPHVDGRTANLLRGILGHGGLSNDEVDSIIRRRSQSYVISKKITRSLAGLLAARLEYAEVECVVVPASLLSDAEIGDPMPLEDVENDSVIFARRTTFNELLVGNPLVVFFFAVPASMLYLGSSRIVFGSIFGLSCGILFTSATLALAIRESSSGVRLRDYVVALANLAVDAALIVILLRWW